MRCDKKDQDIERGHYTLRRMLVIKHLENDDDRVYAARTRVAMNDWLGCLAALRELYDSGKHSCSIPNFGGRLVLTGKGAEAHTGRSDVTVRGGQSPGYFSIPTSNKSAHLYVTTGWHNYID